MAERRLGSWRSSSIAFDEKRQTLLLLVLAASIPVLLFAGWMAYHDADQRRTAALETAQRAVERVAERVRTRVRMDRQGAEALALSSSLDNGDVEAFRRDAARLLAVRPSWLALALDRADGTAAMAPLGGDFETAGDVADIQSVAQLQRGDIGGLSTPAALGGRAIVILRSPVLRDGETRYVLSLALSDEPLAAALRTAGLPQTAVAALVDRQGRIIARNVDASSNGAGAFPSPALRAAVTSLGEGAYTGQTSKGVAIETTFATLADVGGWSVHFGIPTGSLDGPVQRSALILLAGVAASLLTGGLLAVSVSSRLARAHLEEQRRADAALRLSEDRSALAIEAAELETWRWDMEGGRLRGSGRLFALLRLDPDNDGASSQDFLDAIHRDDRTSISRAAEGCLRGDPFEQEFRLSSDARRWLRIRGRVLDRTEPGVIFGVLVDVSDRKQADVEHVDLLRRLENAREDTQARIARDLHDEVGQTVTGLSLGLKGLDRVLRTLQKEAPPRDKSAWGRVRERMLWLQGLAVDLSRDVHRAAVDLRPTALDDLGLARALGAYLADWQERYGVAVDFESRNVGERLPADIETALYRVVQEALTNVLKHARATNVSVILERRDNGVSLVIEDDGKGFAELKSSSNSSPRSPATAPAADNGPVRLGLSSMHERMARIGGTLEIETAEGAGTTLYARIALEAPASSLVETA